MRRFVQASICLVVIWFGILEIGSGMLDKSEAARENKEGYTTNLVSYQYETRPLLGEPSQAIDEVTLAKETKEKTVTTARDESSESVAGHANLVFNKPQEGKIIYLTFDDGPSKHTPEVLDILRQEDVRATFFLLGEHVLQNPSIAKRIVEEGHAVGNHSFNHKYDQLYGSFDKFADQIMQTDDAIYEATGIRTTLLRAPGGTHTNFDQGYFDALSEAGYRVHDWNVDSGDSKRRGVPAGEIIVNVKSSKLPNTLNVLLHDSVGHEQSVKALPEIISYYKGLGYRFEILNENVKPMQFQTAKRLKWERDPVTNRQQKKLQNFANKLIVSGERTLSKLEGPALIVNRGDEQLILGAEEYKLIDGSIHVPLLKLTEWLGGEAEVDEKSGIVEANLQGKSVFWLADARSTSSHKSVQLIDVPIRATLGEFGISIADYVYNNDQREVWIKE
ncbi:polysaccharide deacetylase [Paenibacillus sp. GSMTC-2017]|uniref:polysaccharide deacetylase family protein n=1 Tax=Paenibacillus sp. GSMTC-2017 TaxID=2794350 RepID=UPI0018D919D4|nr:polysaccharide deacetylase family protein [Paenibacillus sp. GSMTC-2017]MBH5318968.1 polysaccharide deacetylase [Paenibacillus sp. GSMTC-2017]